MNKDFRLALMRDWQRNGRENVIDFTDYTRKAEEPGELTRKWSLMGEINQKRSREQDTPRPLDRISPDGAALVRERYPNL
jgi:hypothetical protein